VRHCWPHLHPAPQNDPARNTPRPITINTAVQTIAPASRELLLDDRAAAQQAIVRMIVIPSGGWGY
jgi:hypothetical protein